MNRLTKIFSIILILSSSLILSSCGSVQAKNNGAAEKKTDANDEFFKDEKSSVFSDAADGSAKPGAQDKNDKSAKSNATALKAKAAAGVEPGEEQNNEADVITDVSRGYATWYGKELQGKPTASGDLFDMNKFTAAHRTFPMGSLVLVRNLENGKKKLVTINDRGPYVDGRIIDVSYAAARDMEFAEKGVARVEIELIEKTEDNFMAKLNDAHTTDGVDSKDMDSDENAEEVEKVSEKDGYNFSEGVRPHNFTVRTGAFKMIHNAEKYKEELEDKYNVNAYLGKKGKWHFVWIGDFENKDKARKFYNKLKTDGLDVLNPRKVP